MRQRGVCGGDLVLSSDWLLPLPHNKVLRLLAAPELTQEKAAAERHSRSCHSVIHSCGFFFSAVIQTNLVLLLLRNREYTFYFVSFTTE